MAYADISLDDRVRFIFHNLILIQASCAGAEEMAESDVTPAELLEAISTAADDAASLLATIPEGQHVHG